MDKKFSASHFHSDREYDVRTVGLSDDSEDPLDFIILQRSEEVDEQDEELEQDTYYVEIGNPSAAGYGGVKGLEVFSDRVIMTFVDSCDWVKPLRTLEIDISSLSANADDVYVALSGIFCGEVLLVRY